LKPPAKDTPRRVSSLPLPGLQEARSGGG
jgi:hypothetical protein